MPGAESVWLPHKTRGRISWSGLAVTPNDVTGLPSWRASGTWSGQLAYANHGSETDVAGPVTDVQPLDLMRLRSAASASIAAIRSATSVLTSATGGGSPSGKRIVPFSTS